MCAVDSRDFIMLVEDEPLVRRGLTMLLTKRGYQVQPFDHADAALRCLERHGAPALLVTDVILPGILNGVDLAVAARVAHPDLPLLFMSGYPSDREAQLSAILDDNCVFLGKPFPLTEFMSRVRSLLAGMPAPP